MLKDHYELTPCAYFAERLRPKEHPFGIEIEIEAKRGGSLPVDGLIGWVPKEERSLRGGIEYISNTPWTLENLRLRVRQLSDAVQERMAEDQHRGSTHIHFNVGQATFKNIINMHILYCAVEPLFMTLAGPFRNGNLFCLSSFDSGNAVNHLRRILQSLRYPPGYQPWPVHTHYSAMSLDPVYSLGSVEFRLFPCSVNSEEVSSWCLAIKALYDEVCVRNDILPCLEAIFRDPTLALNIFSLKPWTAPRDYADLVRFGVETAWEMGLLVKKKLADKEEKKSKNGRNPEEIHFEDGDF